MLAPFARQGHPKGGHELSVRPAAIDELDRIGGKGRGSFEATLCQPWYVAAALLEVLAVHDYRAEALVRRDVVVDILRGVGFAIHQKPAVAEPDILSSTTSASTGSERVFSSETRQSQIGSAGCNSRRTR